MEIIVVLAIVSILLAVLGNLILSPFNMFRDIAGQNEAKLIGDTLYQWVFEEMILAASLEILPEGSPLPLPGGKDAIYVQNGRLYFNGTDVYGETYYMGLTMKLKAQKKSRDVISITVELYRNGELKYTTGSSMVANNLRNGKQEIQPIQPAGTVNPVVENPVILFQLPEY